jgi:hypothetical protein
VVIIDPMISLPLGASSTQFPIELRDPLTECLIMGGFTEVGATKVALDLTDPTTKSVWIGHRRWRPPMLNNTEVEQVTSNRHLGDILVRVGQGVHAYSARGPGGSPTNPWLPMSVNRVPDESTMNGISASAKDRGTMVWVDSPSAGNSNLRVFNGTTWNNVPLS